MADPRDEVGRVVAERPNWFRRASPYAILSTLGAAALAPVIPDIVAGAPVGATLATVAGVAGNVGAGYVTGFVTGFADRIRGRAQDTVAVQAELEQALAEELTAGREANAELANDLLTVLIAVDGLNAAIEAAHGDLRARLDAAFTALIDRNEDVLRRLDALDVRQRRLARDQRLTRAAAEEAADRLRDQMTRSPDPAGGGGGAEPAGSRPVVQPVVSPARVPGNRPGEVWAGGADIVVGPDTYLLHDAYLGERHADDHGTVWRWARGVRIVPAPGPGEGYVWLRRVEAGRDPAAGRAAAGELAREHELLKQLRNARGVPRIMRYATDEHGATLATVWPGSRARPRPCDCLTGLLDSGRNTPGPLDVWRTTRLLRGLAGLCRTLATLHQRGLAHRSLAPDVLIALDDAGLVLRDLGLAAVPPMPGEGPEDYRAPEQTRRHPGRPGPPTDVYQLAAVSYHLITGDLPHPRVPLPIRNLAPDVSEPAARALDVALTPDPAERPGAAHLTDALRSVA